MSHEQKKQARAFCDQGILVNSAEFSGQGSAEAGKNISQKFGQTVTKYKLQDWVFSRQRYWGEPIPVLHNPENLDEIIPLNEKDLPLELPKVKSYEPTGTGESPLANIKKWLFVETGKGKDKKKWRRETNTMPQWAGSSWYYLRYMDPLNNKKLVDDKKEKYWGQVDYYVGGAEHATRHLIYARFYHKFLYDIGVVSTKEPFKHYTPVGLVLGEDGRKISKRFNNGIDPIDVVKVWGADATRLYIAFMGPFTESVAWNSANIIGVRRFLERFWRLQFKVSKKVSDKSYEIELNKTIKKVGDDIAQFSHNTAVSAMMILLNEMEKQEKIAQADYLKFVQILAPFAPHITEELWQVFGQKGSVHLSAWPKFDQTKLVDEQVKIAVQVNGKVRAVVEVKNNLAKEKVLAVAKQNEQIRKWIDGKQVVKEIVVPNKIVNIVVKQ